MLNAIRKIDREEVHEHAVRGQYSNGWMKGKQVQGYRQEKNVSPNSPVETFAAVNFYIDNWRWQNVPFYVRTGKHLHEKTTLITIQFKRRIMHFRRKRRKPGGPTGLSSAFSRKWISVFVSRQNVPVPT